MILLIQPSVGRYDKLGIRIPIGLLYVATYLKKHDIQSEIIDTRINKKWEKEILQRLKETNIVGITCKMGPQVREALKIAKFVKSKKPDVIIVFGGVHPTSVPEQVLKKPYIDIVVREDGEKPFLELSKNHRLSEIKGISFKKRIGLKEEIVHNPLKSF